jgi:hypothetical protein
MDLRPDEITNDVKMIKVDEPRRRIYIKFINEERMQTILQSPQTNYNFTTKKVSCFSYMSK